VRLGATRPVTLVGVGHGAALILSCLVTLERMGIEGLGLIDDVFLIGDPTATHHDTL